MQKICILSSEPDEKERNNGKKSGIMAHLGYSYGIVRVSLGYSQRRKNGDL
jgi:hypothetical protein